MADFLPNVLLYYGCYIAIIFATYSIGHLFTSCFNTLIQCDAIQRVFLKIVFGAVILVAIFAIIWTKGNSILIIALLSLAYFVYENRKDFIKPKLTICAGEYKGLLCSLLIFTILFAASYLAIFVWRSGMSNFGDPLFYSNVSSILINSHVETTALFDQTSATPYHYGELWFNGLLASLFGLNYYFTQFLITYPFWLALCGIGAICISNIFIPHKRICYFLGICFILYAPLSGNTIYYINHLIFGKTFEFSYPVIASFKLAPLCVLMLGYSISLLSKHLSLTSLFAGLIVSFYSPAGPAIIISTVLYYAYQNTGLARLFNKDNIFCIAISLCIIIFYVINTCANTFGINNSISYDFDLCDALSHCAKLLLIETCIIIVPVVLFLVLNKNDFCETTKKIFVLLILPILIICIISAVISQINMDGEQLFINIAVILNNIIIFSFILYLGKNVNKYFIGLIPFSALLFISMPQRGILYHQLRMKVEKEYVQEATDILKKVKEYKKKDNPEFGYFANYEKRFSPNNLNSLRLNLSYPCTEFMYMSNKDGIYKPYCLSAMDIPKDIDSRFYDAPKSQLYKFINKQIASGDFSDNESAIESFIAEKNIGIILVENGAHVPNKVSDHLALIAHINDVSLFQFIR